MKKKIKQNSGITLIALIITIIILILLAAITINILFGSDGIIKRTQEATTQYSIETAKEQLELIKATVKLNKQTLNLDNYMSELEKVKDEYKIVVAEKNLTNAEVIVDGKYKFLILDKGNGEIEIIYDETAIELTLSATSGTITYPNIGSFTVTKNISGGILSVKSSNENVATAIIEGTGKITIIPKAITSDGQKATITVTSAATENYEEKTATYEVTVNRGIITLSATPYTGVYDGSSHDVLANVNVTPVDATVKYALGNDTLNTTMPKITNASEYTIFVEASKPGYKIFKTTYKVIVEKLSTIEGSLTLSAPSATITYPNTGTFTVTKNVSGGELSVKSSNENVATASINGNTVTVVPKAITTDGQKATITVTSAATSNYEAQTATYEVTVNRGTITLSATPYTGSYDGSVHDALTNVTVTPSDVTVKYALGDGEFTAEMPKVTNASEYTVSIEATKAGYRTFTDTYTVTIGKSTSTAGNLTLSETSGTITYPNIELFTVSKNATGGELSVKSSNENIATVAINGTIVTITPKAITTDGQKVTITVTSSATSNYVEQTATYVATVNRGTIELSATPYTGSYDGQAHDALTINSKSPSDVTVKYALGDGEFTAEMPKVTNASEYTISIEASKAGYKTFTDTYTVTIGKANASSGNLTLSETSGTITYPETKTFTVNKNASEGKLSVKSSNENIATASIDSTGKVTITPKAITSDGQKVTITVTSAATSNYVEQTATYVATVNRGTIEISLTPYIGTYDGSAHDAITSVTVTPSDAIVKYAIGNGNLSTTMPKVTNVGKYTISVTAEKSGYKIKTESKISKVVHEEIKVDINTTINGSYIITKNGYDSGATITNLSVKNSSGTVVGTQLNGYDIYKVSYTIEEAGSKYNINQTYITKPTSSMTLKNVLTNPSFENGTGTYFNGTIGTTTDQKRSGNYSMWYSCSNAQAFPNVCYGDIGINGNPYYVRGHYLSTNLNFHVILYAYEAKDPGETWTREGEMIANKSGNLSSGWGVLSGIQNPYPSNYKYLQLQIAQGNKTGGSGTLYWDDFMCLVLDTKTWGVIPTKAWLDKMIPYFEGTKTISSW